MTLVSSNPEHLTQRELESALWAAANALRGPVDAGDFKQYVFPILFFKWISDMHDYHHEEARRDLGEFWTQQIEDDDYQTFTVPDGAHWDDVITTTRNIGLAINNALVSLQEANAGKLEAVFGDVNWSNKERLPENALRDLLDAFDRLTLNPNHVSGDMLGAAYEYLIREFAEASGRKAGEFFTPRHVVHLLVRLLDPQTGDHIADPACGSGNFLTETYIHLRRLENKVLSELHHHQGMFALNEEESPLKVSLRQFHGIEINDFAVSVALTALWIAELQANAEAQTIVYQVIDDLPLQDAANVVLGNALTTDWNSIIPAEQCDYIIGNPPFLGYSRLSAEQKQDRALIFGKSGGVLDYVACWYGKAASFMEANREIEAAFVSTNSICQGQQVALLWQPLFGAGITINFAHRTFIWANESSDQAHVYCVIVGFSYRERKQKWVWDYRRPSADERATFDLPAGAQIGERKPVSHLNGYLADAPDVFLARRLKPISDVPEMAQGFKPADGGNLLLSAEERDTMLAHEPEASHWIRKFSMGAEFINGVDRYCLWLPAVTPAAMKGLPSVRARVDSCREWRLTQIKTGDAYKLADTPHLLRPSGKFRDGTYIGVPAVSSERRKYIPMGFVDDGMIPGNKLYFIPTDSKYVFGILMSRVHNAWMRTVTGRLKSDYNYGNTTVYNNLVWPDVSSAQRTQIELLAQAVLDARANHPEATLADLYDPDNDFLYYDLVHAHRALDDAVERAYGLEPGCPESEIVAHLFKLYSEATTTQP